jgi:2-keto-4-pentenoate hydratase/2-oxohepta-3-ene-1,7-dioic acid hydratase in catechol pathway
MEDLSENSMRLVTFQRYDHAEPGILRGDQIISVRAAGFEDALSIVAGGAAAREKVDHWMQSAPAVDIVRSAGVKLLAPLPRPPKIICVGLNYRDHAEESKMEIPSVPTIFCKFPTSVIGPGDNIVLPKNSVKPDYEGEFAFVVGKRGRHVAAADWKDYVFGYTILNDVSARDWQMATTQWMMGKTFDTFAPFGPALVTADEIADPHALDISTTIGGETLQNSNTRHLIFKIPDLIAHLSAVFTLEPGDIVSTGTPAGVGFSRNPPRWLRPGDEVVVRVQGLGELRNPVIAEV